jgi:hypothetical protein
MPMVDINTYFSSLTDCGVYFKIAMAWLASGTLSSLPPPFFITALSRVIQADLKPMRCHFIK